MQCNGNIVEASRLTLKTKVKIVSRVDIACTKLSQILPKLIKESVIGHREYITIITKVPIGRTPRCKARILIHN